MPEKYKNLPPYLSYKNGALHYENMNIYELVERYGSPLEVAYTDMINTKIKTLKGMFESSIEKNNYRGRYLYAYATKANYYSEVVSTSLNNSDLLETSSGYDLDIIEKLFIDRLIPAGFTIVCNGFKKGYYFEKIVKLRKKGLNIIPVLENEEEVEMFLNSDVEFNVGMRINIDEQNVKAFVSEGRSGSAIDTRFGLYFEDMVESAKKINISKHLKFKLFHFHLGGTIRDIKEYATFMSYLYEKNYCELKTFCENLEYFDIGGGFPTQYNLDFGFDYQFLTDTIVKTVMDISDRKGLPHPNIIGEHGRYTVADHSFFVYEISIVKESNQDSLWYLINSSLMNYLPDSWALGQDFVILPINLIENELVKVKLGGLTCDPDDTYYKQEKENFLYFPEVKKGEKLYIAVFGTGAYQEMIAGVGGVHHCMIPEGNELIVRKVADELEFNHINHIQSPKEILDTLDYGNTHNLMQYLNKYDIEMIEFEGSLKDYYDKLKDDFPQSEIFPFENLEKAYNSGDYKVVLLRSKDAIFGYAFIALLKKTGVAILNYLCIFKEYRDKGYGHILVNSIKSHFGDYQGLLAEVEIPENKNELTDKVKRVNFYNDLDFVIQNLKYEIYATDTKEYLPMHLMVCNLKRSSGYEYGYGEMREILDEYYKMIFEDNFSTQYKLDYKNQQITTLV